MKVIEEFSSFDTSVGSVVTIGTFDGVHVGHRKILKRIVDKAISENKHSVVLTFWPHPRFVLNSNSEGLKLLTTFDEKVEVIESAGVDYLVKIPFTHEFSEFSSMEFIEKILIDGLNTQDLVIGYDHKFGKNREGSFEYLQKHAEDLGFNISEISRKDIEDVAVSSTAIRNALSEGSVPVANEFLGRKYQLSGIVVNGDRLGRNIGFPTANISVPETYKLIPADGSYAVLITFNQEVHKGMLNIGKRPTVNGQDRRIEVHIFDFDLEIYDQMLTIQFVGLLRLEMKFENLEMLKEQLKLDKLDAIKLLNND